MSPRIKAEAASAVRRMRSATSPSVTFPCVMPLRPPRLRGPRLAQADAEVEACPWAHLAGRDYPRAMSDADATGRPRPADGLPGKADAAPGPLGPAWRPSTAIVTAPNAVTLIRLLLMPVCALLLAGGPLPARGGL